MFLHLLQIIFLKGNKSAGIIVPSAGLSGLFSVPAEKFLLSKNCTINLSARVEEIICESGRVTKIRTGSGLSKNYDYILSCIPYYALMKILPQDPAFRLSGIPFEYSPILSVHLWLNENPFDFNYCGVINSPLHWVFNHGKYLTALISDAGNLVKLTDDEIRGIIYSELKKNFPIFKKSLITDSMIIWEKRATFIPSSQINNLRKQIRFGFHNLILAGDWINTGLPATIEGAVKSGRMASERINQISQI